ncbi:subtilisin-like protein [Westerdykella ornata]|uniref:Subtilisin-like protein n=1 Tax=Westerdykella ornata TaxID=318751 RepID=A0A6A6J4U4_WESOR|nr:subtilisin-like protein [Westerdykella ornata]KAF2271600.1 subtilisin-like protein [Westerdykella ornata]
MNHGQTDEEKLARAKQFGAKGLAKENKQEWEEAATCFMQAVLLYERIRGEDDEKVIVLRDHWALNLHKAKLYEQAISCNKESLKRRLKSGVKPDDWALLENRRHLARNYDRSGQFRNAIVEYRAILTSQNCTVTRREGKNTGIDELCEDAIQCLDLSLEYAQQRGMSGEAKTYLQRDLTLCDRVWRNVKAIVKESRAEVAAFPELQSKLAFASKELGQMKRSVDYLKGDTVSLGQREPNRANNGGNKQWKGKKKEESSPTQSPSSSENRVIITAPSEVKSGDGKSDVESKAPSLNQKRVTNGATPVQSQKEQKKLAPPTLNVDPAPRVRSRSQPPAPDKGVGRRRSVNMRVEPKKTQTDSSKASKDLSLPSGCDTSAPLSFTKDLGMLFGASRENQTDKWFLKLEATVHTFLNRHQQSERRNKIKIAVLDTGVAIESASKMKVAQKLKNKIIDTKGNGKKLANGLDPNVDNNGHGTDCFCLLMRVCPYAVIYPYRIVSEDINEADGINPEYVKEALDHAINTRKVDIVSMSFGWQYNSHEGLRNIITESKNVLLFAATSNDGRDIKYPASDDHVIGIDAAHHNANPSRDNPSSADTHLERFSALGVDILSVVQDERRRGTSFATPVAAATAGLLLEFAKQPPLCFAPEVQACLKTKTDMLKVIRALFVFQKQGFKFIDITKLSEFNGEDDAGRQGAWYLPSSQRYRAAMKVLEVLRGYHGPEFGKAVEENCEKCWQERIAAAASKADGHGE